MAAPEASTWTGLKEALAKKYEFLGSRAAELPLPPCWAKHGVYNFAVVEDGEKQKMVVTHNFLPNQPVREIEVPPSWSATRVQLVDNYSESQAYLWDPQVQGMPIKLMALFDTTLLNTSRPRMRRPASSSSLCTPESCKRRLQDVEDDEEFVPKRLHFEEAMQNQNTSVGTGGSSGSADQGPQPQDQDMPHQEGGGLDLGSGMAEPPSPVD